MNAIAPIGHNNPPEELTPYQAVKVHLDDLLTEARNWADGTVAETQTQVDEIARLIDDLNKGIKAGTAAKVEEKKPLDEKVAEIQARWNVYIGDPKTKAPGKVYVAIDALNAAKRPFLQEQERLNKEAAEEARRVAQEAADKAAEAARAATADDLEAREAAELLVAQAHRAESAARAAEQAKAHAHGGNRATGLRSYWTPQIADRKAALLHYINTRPDACEAWLIDMAKSDVANGKRTIPGFDVIEERR